MVCQEFSLKKTDFRSMDPPVLIVVGPGRSSDYFLGSDTEVAQRAGCSAPLTLPKRPECLHFFDLTDGFSGDISMLRGGIRQTEESTVLYRRSIFEALKVIPKWISI